MDDPDNDRSTAGRVHRVYLLKEKYGIEVKERRGRFSYLHPERSKFITGHALGSDFEKEHVGQMILQNYPAKDPDIQNTQDHDHEAIPAVNDSASDRNPAPDRKDFNPTYDYHADPVHTKLVPR